MEIIETKVSTILRPTGIDLASYVINPYQGCQLGCFFCYAQFNRVAQKEKMSWGSYVKVKINALEVLEQELDKLKPKKILLGSTTECFQPIEKKFKITGQILKLLNNRKIKYIILSRAPLIAEYLPWLRQGFCETIYFTVDVLPDRLRKISQPQAIATSRSIQIINNLTQNKINVIAYFCPIMPWLFDSQDVLNKIPGKMKYTEFEILNFNMAGSQGIMKFIKDFYPEHVKNYTKLLKNKSFYEKTINNLEREIKDSFNKKFTIIRVHKHKYGNYFNNRYDPAKVILVLFYLSAISFLRHGFL
ncbi:MAG: radical SAM protein [Candidatus Omnitrophota bacterium]